MKFLIKILICVSLFVLLALSVAAEDKITVVLDPGHGGYDPGTTVGTRYESEYINDLTSYLKEYLEETGKFEVIVTRGEDEYLKLLSRALKAYYADADILISLHFNSAETPYKSGVEVLASVLDEWYPEKLSRAVTASISKKCGLADGGVIRREDTGDSRGVYYWNEKLQWDIPAASGGRRSDYYGMVSWGTKLGFPAIIVEHAYLSNYGDLAFCDSADGIKKLARAEADAIIEYYTGHTHTYGELTCDRVANCCFEGVFSRKCTVCGHRKDITQTAVNPQLHGWTEEVQNATCTADGYINRECQISRNLSEKGLPDTELHPCFETLHAIGHDVTVDFERAAGHGVDGYKKESCKNCGEVWEYYTAGDPHVYVSDGVEISCSMESPEVNYICTVCGDTQVRTVEIPPHSFEVKKRVEPSCETDGFELLRCTVCSFEKTELLPALDHDYGDKLSEVRCDTESAEITYTCARCNATLTETVEIPPHETSLTARRAPDCEADGFEEYTCVNCGKVITKVLPATGHSYGEGEAVRKASLFSEGEIRFLCENDSSHVKLEAIPPKGGGIFIILVSAAGAVLVVALIGLVLLKGANRRLREVADEASAILEKEKPGAEAESEAEAEAEAEATAEAEAEVEAEADAEEQTKPIK